MSTAHEDLAEGLAALDAELGESYALQPGGVAFVARLERNRPRDLAEAGGVIRETVLHVQRAQAAFSAGLPAVSTVIQNPLEESARLARIDPGDLPGMLVFVLASEFS